MNPNYTTDGPWSSDSEFISSPDGFIAQVVERDTPRETEANGRLIASAPDLLAALEVVLSSTCGNVGDDGYEGCIRIEAKALDRAIAAISKAKGNL
jgi:hypothetical protein